jgi:hypothetical protein
MQLTMTMTRGRKDKDAWLVSDDKLPHHIAWRRVSEGTKDVIVTNSR